jgi:hypothetical protein
MYGSHPATHSAELSAAGPEAGRRARHLRILADLADIGMELVQHVRQRALAEEAPPEADPVLAFARLAKAVRQTVALEAKVAAGGFDAPSPVSRSAAPSEGAFRPWDGKMKAKVRLKVEETIACGAEPGDAEDLLRDLNERLDDPEYGDEMSDRPIGMAVALICGALGVRADLKDFTDAEMGFDTEAPTWTGSRPSLDGPGGDGEATVWRHRVAAGLGLSSVSRHATGLLKTRAETDTRFPERPKPDD